MKAPEKREENITDSDLQELPQDIIKDLTNLGWNDSRDTWHKWIDEAPIEEIIADKGLPTPLQDNTTWSQEGVIPIAQAIRNLLKGENGGIE